MTAMELVEKAQLIERPRMKAGDTVKVHVRVKEGDKERIQVFEGIVIGLRRGGNRATFTVRKVSVVIDSYLTVNPANVEAQLAGGVVHGLNATLYGQQTFSNGAAQKRNFNVNRMIRLQEMPQVAVGIMPRPAAADRSVPIGGVGELGVPTLAPALANAVFKLSGQRVRTLPFFPNATMGGL